jgi:hypothetical protein
VAKPSQRLDWVVPMQHGVEATLLALFDLGHLNLSYSGQGLGPGGGTR